MAVQQGSHLQEEISKVILELQKDRYFETLSGICRLFLNTRVYYILPRVFPCFYCVVLLIFLGKYWNNTLRSLCPVLDDSEGITLRSLGGVFIATLVGLGIAMLVLIVEVIIRFSMSSYQCVINLT